MDETLHQFTMQGVETGIRYATNFIVGTPPRFGIIIACMANGYAANQLMVKAAVDFVALQSLEGDGSLDCA